MLVAAECLQEVVSADKPRFSISGWYHKDKPQEGSENASLQQLQMKAGEDQIKEHSEFAGTCRPLGQGDCLLALLTLCSGLITIGTIATAQCTQQHRNTSIAGALPSIYTK